jgi:hypothetical protein
MTLYFVGGEDSSFTFTGTVAVLTNSNVFRSAFSREAVGSAASSPVTTAWPMGFSMATPQWGPVSSFWCHGQYAQNSPSFGNFSNATTASAILMALADSGGVGRILIRGTGTAGQVKISTRNAAGTIVDLVTSAAGAIPAPGNGVPVTLDLFVNYAVSGQVTLYANGANIADTGPGVNVTTDSATALGQLFLGFMLNTTFSGGWSECIVQSTTTQGMSLWTLVPAAAGNTQSWTPNTVADINKTTINDSTFISTTGTAALSEWTTNTTVPPGVWSVAAVVEEGRLSVGTTGPQHFEWLIRTADGSDHTTGTIAPTNSFSNFTQQWLTNPHTGSAWATGDITTGFNIGVESLA